MINKLIGDMLYVIAFVKLNILMSGMATKKELSAGYDQLRICNNLSSYSELARRPNNTPSLARSSDEAGAT